MLLTYYSDAATLRDARSFHPTKMKAPTTATPATVAMPMISPFESVPSLVGTLLSTNVGEAAGMELATKGGKYGALVGAGVLRELALDML